MSSDQTWIQLNEISARSANDVIILTFKMAPRLIKRMYSRVLIILMKSFLVEIRDALYRIFGIANAGLDYLYSP